MRDGNYRVPTRIFVLARADGWTPVTMAVPPPVESSVVERRERSSKREFISSSRRVHAGSWLICLRRELILG